MGQSPSKAVRVKSGRRWSLRSPLPRKSKSNLSHTFSFSAINENVELINVNHASEEQLMTLSGITRQVAQAIVDHRQAIGRFKKIDDLALVSGMGAEKLNTIRAEVCVGRKLVSSSNSRAQSLDSIGSVESARVQLNINTVNVFQLQCIPGLNQELAANIVDYRSRKGLFKSLDDLIKVKGIDTMRLGSIKSHLSLNHDDESPKTLTDNFINHRGNGTNGTPAMHVSKSALLNGSAALPRTPGHRKSLSVPIKCTNNLSNGFSMAPVNDIFDLLSAYSRRPIIEEEFTYVRDGKPAYRVATWNLHQLSNEKANNPGFREVLCRTILENKFSILGIQEVLDEEALKTICNELNAPTLRRICEWKENSKKWLYHITSSQIETGQYFGILYDEFSVNIHIEIYPFNNKTEENTSDFIPEENMDKEKIFEDGQYSNLNYAIIECKVNKTHILLVNIYLAGENNPEYSTALLCEMIDKLLKNRKNIIIIGDFHSLKNVEDIASCYKSVIDPLCSTFVDTSGGASHMAGRAAMLVPSDSQPLHADKSGIVRSGLSHLAIPHGWSWGGPASPHCPIWSEFFTH